MSRRPRVSLEATGKSVSMYLDVGRDDLRQPLGFPEEVPLVKAIMSILSGSASLARSRTSFSASVASSAFDARSNKDVQPFSVKLCSPSRTTRTFGIGWAAFLSAVSTESAFSFVATKMASGFSRTIKFLSSTSRGWLRAP
jgi:hypothetical protein